MISFSVVYNNDDETIIGFNAFGMRLRHAVCDQWLQEKRNIDEVISELHKLNFDPEFFDRYEEAILSAYNKENGKTIRGRRKKRFSLF